MRKIKKSSIQASTKRFPEWVDAMPTEIMCLVANQHHHPFCVAFQYLIKPLSQMKFCPVWTYMIHAK